MGSSSISLIPAHLASLWSLCRAWSSHLESMTPACSEARPAMVRSAWMHTLHVPPHWVGVPRGPGGSGFLRVLAIAPLPGSHVLEWDPEEQGKEGGNELKEACLVGGSRGRPFRVKTPPISPPSLGEQGTQDSEGQLRDTSQRPASFISCSPGG